MIKSMAQSPSSLKLFETCPRKYKGRYIDHLYASEGNQYTRRGEEIHKLMANEAIGSPTSWPETERLPMVYGRAFLDETLQIESLKAGGCDVLVEKSVAITTEIKAVEFFDPDAWVRSRIDLAIIPKQKGERGIVVDWKTGKTKGDINQLIVNGLCLRGLCGVTNWIGAFVYLDQRTADVYSFDVFGPGAELGLFFNKLDQLRAAHETEDFPANPGPHCRWCEIKEGCQ